MAVHRVHQRSLSELKHSPQSPYLPDAAVRAPKMPTGLSVESPLRLPRPTLFNDGGSEMFLAVAFRKDTQQQLQIMENRVKALQKAEDEARRKLETARRLTREKTAFQDTKQREIEGIQQWRGDVQRARSSSRLRIGEERQARRERLQQARERANEERMNKAIAIKQDLKQRFADLRVSNKEALRRKEERRLHIITQQREARTQAEASHYGFRTRVQSEFQDKLHSERRQRMQMEQRIKELEEVEMQLTQNLKRTCSFHSQEVQRLDELVRS